MHLISTVDILSITEDTKLVKAYNNERSVIWQKQWTYSKSNIIIKYDVFIKWYNLFERWGFK